MTLPPFTLVHTSRPAAGRAKRELEHEFMEGIRTADPGLAESLGSVRPTLRRALLRSSFTSFAPTMSSDAIPTPPIELLGAVVGDLTRGPRVVTVGVWDLGANVARLPAVVEAINAAQPIFTFFEVHAAIPAGMVSRPERVIAWARRALGRPLRSTERKEIEDNVIDRDFFDRAERIRGDLGINYMVGVTPSMVAWEAGSELGWNYFTTSDGHCVLVSAHNLREYAAKAERPYEVGIAALVLAQLMVELNRGLEFHEDTGCLFDLNIDRVGLVRSLRGLAIQADCRTRLSRTYQDAALEIVEALSRYPERPQAGMARRPGSP
jgi:hypothetical protein